MFGTAKDLSLPRHLQRRLQHLMDASVLARDLPFGESSRTTKRTLYQIQDPAIRFWFGVYSPHQSLWRSCSEEKKKLLIHGHAASVFEDWCRSMHPGARRYWDKFSEIDLACPDPENPDGLLVGESKWKRLTSREHDRVLNDLKDRWGRCQLAARHPNVRLMSLTLRCWVTFECLLLLQINNPKSSIINRKSSSPTAANWFSNTPNSALRFQ